MTSIRYFIPDDGDTEDEPNVFLAPKNSTYPRLSDIKESFPVPGKYHFRFKTTLGGENGLAVWMDCIDDGVQVPVYRNNVIVKVTRISADDFFDDDSDDDEEFERLRQNGHAHTAATTVAAATVAPSYNRAASTASSVSEPTPRASPAPVVASEDLLNVFEDQPTRTYSNPPSSNGSAANLLDEMDDLFGGNSAPQPATTTSSVSNDFLGMTMDATPAVSKPLPTPTAPSSLPVRPVPAQQRQTSTGYPNAFDQFTKKSEPFGGLNWN